MNRIRARTGGDDVVESGAGDDDGSRQCGAVDILEIRDGDRVAGHLIGAGSRREIYRRNRRRAGENQRVGTRAAIDRNFGSMVDDAIRAGAAVDHVGAGSAVNHVGSRAADQRVGARRACQRDRRRQSGGVDALNIRHIGGVAQCHVALGEIDRYRRFEDKRVIGARAAVDRDFGTVISDPVVAAACGDDVGAAAAIDGIFARAARQQIGGARPRDRRALRGGKRGGVDILEAADGRQIAARLVEPVEIDRHARVENQRIRPGAAVDRGLRPAISDAVVARAGVDDVGAAAAIDRIRARARRDHIGDCGAEDADGCREDRRVHILEIRDDNGIAAGLVHAFGRSEIDRRDAAARGHDERIVARTAADRGFIAVIGDDVVAAGGVDDVGAALAVDHVVARAAGDGVGAGRAGQADARRQGGGVDILEVRNRRRIADGLIDRGQIDVDRRVEHQLVGVRAAVDAVFRTAIGDDIGARACDDNVRAARAIDDVVAGACRDRVGETVARHRHRLRRPKGGRIDILEIADERRIAGRLIIGAQIDGRLRIHDQRVGARAAIDGGFSAAIVDHVGARAARNHVETAAAVNRIGARAADDRVVFGAAGDGHAARQRAGVDILETRDGAHTADDLIGGGQIDRRCGFHDKRVGARAGVDSVLGAVESDTVGAAPRRNRICPAKAVDHVGGCAAGDGVVARRADKRIGARRGTDDVGDADERVAFRPAAGADAGRQIDGDAIRRAAVIDRVVAARADESVRAAAPDENVVAGIAAQTVGVGGAFDIAEIRDDVAGGVAALADARREIDAHACGRHGVGHGVDAAAAVQRIVARARIDDVVAGARRYDRARRHGIQYIDRRLAVRRRDRHVGFARHIGDREDLIAGIETRMTGGVLRREQHVQGEIAEEPIDVRGRAFRRQDVAQRQLQVVRVQRIEIELPVRAVECGVIDREAGGQVGDRHGLRHHAGVRQQGVDVDETFGGSRRHPVGIGDIDDVVVCRSGDGFGLLLDSESGIGRRGRDRGGAENFLSAAGQCRDIVSRHAEQLNRQLGRGDVAVAVAVARRCGGVRIRRRAGRGRRADVIVELFEARIDRVFRRPVEIGDAFELRRRVGGNRRRDRRLRGRRLLRLFLLGGAVFVGSRAQCLEIAVLDEARLADRGKQLLPGKRLIREDDLDLAGRHEIERVAGKDDLRAVGESHDQIDVERHELGVCRVEIELEIGAGRHLLDDDLPRRRTMNDNASLRTRLNGEGCGLDFGGRFDRCLGHGRSAKEGGVNELETRPQTRTRGAPFQAHYRRNLCCNG